MNFHGLAPTAPDEMLEGLLRHINAQFYTGTTAKRWHQDHRHLMRALTWPATWLRQRRIEMPLERYESILREIILEIQRHGDTGKVRHFPSYLAECVRLWFVHNGDELWEESKRLRAKLDVRFLKGLPTAATTAVPGADPIEAMAAAHRVLAAGKPRAKAAKNDDSQPSLFDL